jgi:glycosyltransferase involved in cell wall biosynthesis
VKFAFFGFPHAGGTHTVYRALRLALARHGIAVRWLGIGPSALAAWDDPRWSSEKPFGDAIASASSDQESGRALLFHLEKHGYDGIFVNVLADRVQMNVARYLSRDVVRIMIVHNITPATYGAASAIKDFVHATVGVSPRIVDDLIGKRGFRKEETTAIPNAIDVTPFIDVRRDVTRGPLRIISLGRVEEDGKGVFWLPRIMKRLPVGAATLTVAGDGPALVELKERCKGMEECIRFVGPVAPLEVPAAFADHDVLLMPSRFEGFGITLIEAMACGCVPVASLVKGVTDLVIDDGKTGFLFPVGDFRCAARLLARLAVDAQLRRRVSDTARNAVRHRFRLDRMADEYANVISRAMMNGRIRPLPFEEWNMPAGFQPGARRFIPSTMKNFLRVWKERRQI